MSKDRSPKNAWVNVLTLMFISFGIILIAASLLPLSSVTDHYWTEQDSAAYDRISLEYHRAAYEAPERAGRSEAEMQAYRDNLRKHYEALRGKLEDAGNQPERWRRNLFWSGTVATAIGVFCLLYQRSAN